ncbi:hypothetical protein E1B28_007618 [Marasmius oreades]|uniref:Uncharacterized protein n=1 Tax=Marasmius oreades TaxID=181124 RepID=A0A9P7S3Q8_9AGAR|nr:uncharacterized protein E1B28_007618 [Marasmius oreades]KAG7093988.1 hypothetical protein E1B28_007618 [Marasmius oreades]
MNAHLAAAVLGFSLTFIDAYFTRQGERDFWKSPSKAIHSPVHWLYILSRYLVLVIQICNIVIATIWKYNYTAIPHNICFVHLIFKICVLLFSLLILDTILMLRVYALYNKSQEMASFLGLILLLKSTTAVWGLARLLPNATSSVHFNYICIAAVKLHEEPGLALFVLGEMAIHCALCWLTLTKTWSFKDLWPHPPTLASVLNRDALSVFAAICGILAAYTFGTYRRGVAVIFAFPILISITSCAGCRLILHLNSLGGRETSTDPENMTFTAIDATITWDTGTHHFRT